MATKKTTSLVQKLATREISGNWKWHKKSKSMLPFSRIPRRMCYRLENLVPRSILEDGHVFLGFTKSGKYVVSYSLQFRIDDDSELPGYKYKLQWWLFVPKKPLRLLSEVKLFGESEISKELYIAFCEWPEDEEKVFVYGHTTSVHRDMDDSCFCYVTITAVPYLGQCLQCQMMGTENIDEEPESIIGGNSQRKTIKMKCLLHSFCVHSRFEVSPPYPSFSPSVQLKLDGVVILNTGVSLVAFQVDPIHRSKRQNSRPNSNTEEADLVEHKPKIHVGSNLSFSTGKIIHQHVNTSPSAGQSESSALVFKNLCDGCNSLPCFCVQENNSGICEVTAEPETLHTSSTVIANENSSCISSRNETNASITKCTGCLSVECSCDTVIRQPLELKNDNSNAYTGTVRSSVELDSVNLFPEELHASKIPIYKSEMLSEYSSVKNNNNLTPLVDSVPTCTFSSPSPRICTERTFFSPSNSNSSITSRSSEGVHVHTNVARTVTYSSRCYEIQDGILDSSGSLEDEYDIAYRSVLPVDVCFHGKTLPICKNISSTASVICVLQVIFDIEHYMIEVVGQQAEWGKRLVAFYNYDLQVLDVEVDGQVLATVYALIQAKDKHTKSSKIAIKMYRTQFTFQLNLCTGDYSTWNIGDLVVVEKENPEECEWNLGTKECNLIRRKNVMPKSFYKSVQMLSNEAACIKGCSKKMLVAPYQSHTTAIIL